MEFVLASLLEPPRLIALTGLLLRWVRGGYFSRRGLHEIASVLVADCLLLKYSLYSSSVKTWLRLQIV